MNRHVIDLRGWVLPVVLVVLAEAALRVSGIQSEALAKPTEVAGALWEAMADGSLFEATAQTLGAGVGGLLIGCGLGLVIGTWFGLYRRAAHLGFLTVELLKPIPSVALIPLSMLLFGFGFRMEILVVAFTCFFPMLILTQSAIAHVEPRLLEVSQVIGLSNIDRIHKIVLPAVLPRVFVALRLCVGIALVVSVTVEISANPYGLGYGMMISQQSLRPDLMFAFLLWIGLLGWTLNTAFVRLQSFLFNPLTLGAGR